jgi:hypothetical protein
MQTIIGVLLKQRIQMLLILYTSQACKKELCE